MTGPRRFYGGMKMFQASRNDEIIRLCKSLSRTEAIPGEEMAAADELRMRVWRRPVSMDTVDRYGNRIGSIRGARPVKAAV